MSAKRDLSPHTKHLWWWRMSEGQRGAAAVTVMIMIFVAIFGTPLLVLQLTRPTFTGDLSAFANIAPGPQATGAPQAMKLKLVIIDTATGKMDHVWDRVVPDLMAANPSEVRTVVLLTWSQDLIGHYEGGGNAYTSNVSVKVVDVATANVIATASFSSDPSAPFVGSAASDSVGSRPEKEVADYLWTLPSDGPPQDLRLPILLFVGFWIAFIALCWWIFVSAPRKARRRSAAGVLGPKPPTRRP